MVDVMELRAIQQQTQPAVDRAWKFAKSPNCTCEEHDDIIAAVRLANRVPQLLDALDEAARRRERVESEPVTLCEMPEVVAMRYIEQLRADEGDAVTILCDDPEASASDERLAIECCGSWTDWKHQRFYGESVLQCLAKAVTARASLSTEMNSEGKGAAEPQAWGDIECGTCTLPRRDCECN
jgi:hypothetical protein